MQWYSVWLWVKVVCKISACHEHWMKNKIPIIMCMPKLIMTFHGSSSTLLTAVVDKNFHKKLESAHYLKSIATWFGWSRNAILSWLKSAVATLYNNYYKDGAILNSGLYIRYRSVCVKHEAQPSQSYQTEHAWIQFKFQQSSYTQ